MKRVLFCIPALGLGGAEEIIARLCNYLCKTYDVELLILQRCDEDLIRVQKLQGYISVKSLFVRSRSSKCFWFKFRNYLIYILFPAFAAFLFLRMRMWEYEVVHLNLSSASLYGAIWYILAKLAGFRIRFIQTFHTNLHLLNIGAKLIFQISWRFVDEIIVEIDPNETAKVAIAAGGRCVKYIPFAVAPPPFRKLNQNNKCVIVFGSLARLRIREKRFDVIIASLAELKKRSIKFEYRIGGDGVDREKIRSMVEESGLTDCVKFHGFIFDAYSFLEEIDVLLVATVGEETGIAGLQALSIGVPFIGINTLGDEGDSKTSEGGSKTSTVRIGRTKTEIVDCIMSVIDKSDRESYFQALRSEKQWQIDDQQMMLAYSDLFGNKNRQELNK
jgi:glycosyltransferase involved in cell wall biosynthesis